MKKSIRHTLQPNKKKCARRPLRAIVALLLIAVFVTAYPAPVLSAISAVSGDSSVYCSTPAHTHSSECYDTVLTCEITESSHEHDESCYETELTCTLAEHSHTLQCFSNPLADVETAEDWAAMFADTELSGVWADDLLLIAETQLDYTESTANYMVADDGETINGYTRYGEWWGLPYQPWAAMFVAFCLEWAGIPADSIPRSADCQSWVAMLSGEAEDYENFDMYTAADTGYTPKIGDLVFFDTDLDGEADSVGITAQYTAAEYDKDGEQETAAELTVIAGDADNAVQYVTYALTDETVLGYAALPENPDSGADDSETTTAKGEETTADSQPESTTAAVTDAESTTEKISETETHTTTEAAVTEQESTEAPTETTESAETTETTTAPTTETTAPQESESTTAETTQGAGGEEQQNPVIDETFTYETDEFTVKLSVSNTDSADENEASGAEAAAGEAQPNYTLLVNTLAEDNGVYTRFSDYVADAAEAGNLLDLSVLEFHLMQDGIEIDLTEFNVSAEVTPKESLLSAARRDSDDDEEVAAEAEAGVLMSVMQVSDDGVSENDSVKLTANTETAPVLYAAELTSNVLAVASEQTANPNFTVQYYTTVNRIKEADEDNDFTLPFIDTSAEANGTATLPTNISTTDPGTAIKNIQLVLHNKSSVAYPAYSSYDIETETSFEAVYKEHDYEYEKAPNLDYFNILANNNSYSLKAIWVLTGSDPTSTKESDWKIYGTDVTFTNNSDYAGLDNYIVITDDTVIRLVYDTTSGTYTNAVNMYDYDITEDGWRTYVSGIGAQGINNPGNYSTSGSKLAFGNSNTHTSLGYVTWNGNNINMANRGKGYQLCCFGLVSGLDSSSNLIYSSGISAPNLFNDGSATGKRSFDSGQYSLNFVRQGDTYTLSAVLSAEYGNLTGLQYIYDYNPYDEDDEDYEEEPWLSNEFWPMDTNPGTDGLTGERDNLGTIQGADDDNINKVWTGNWPVSDEYVAHNNMFGMLYAVQFTMTSDYQGPLEYIFYGDDDMWVFLDGKLICDIGGVHSSVGEYVNLWDYLGYGDSGTHTLTFYYTERGLSGSSCYMQFTLPSISSATPGQSTGALAINKQIDGNVSETNSNADFTYQLDLYDSDGKELIDIYATYIRTNADGDLIESGPIKSGSTFQLKANEQILITGLPDGTQFTLTETNTGGASSASYTVNNGTKVTGTSVSGVINTEEIGTVNINFTNTFGYELPKLGGAGTGVFTIFGTILMAGGLLPGYLIVKRRKERE